jgi:hypothetical protein
MDEKMPAIKLPPNLCYTLALDKPGQDFYHKMTRLLVTSLLLTKWHGKIFVFRNRPRPVLPEGHPIVTEVVLDLLPSDDFHDTVSWKYRVRNQLPLDGFAKVLFVDCDCLALRSINYLMMGSWDIYTAPEPGRIVDYPFNGYLTEAEMQSLHALPGLNSGNFGVRASRYKELMAAWEKIDRSQRLRGTTNQNQHSWNRLILDTALRHRHFARGELQFPFLNGAHYLSYRHAALVHACDRSAEEKLSFLFGLWMDVFGGDRLDEVTKIEPPFPMHNLNL